MGSNQLVSAIIPTKNRASLLERSVNSVLNQSYSNLELIIVNDGSTDSTTELLQSYQTRAKISVIIINNKRSVGAPAARNQAIEKAAGSFIAGLDDDDEWHKDRISALVHAYSDDYSCITSDTVMIYPRGEAIWKKKKRIDLKTLLFTNQVGNQVLARRDRIMEIGGFDPNLQAAQDYDLWVRLCAKYGAVRNVQKPLQKVYMDHRQERITDRSFKGYLQFYNKHKHRMNREQRKYQLYNIRRAQGKRENLQEFLSWVPSHRYFKEVKRILADRLWK